MAVHHANGKQRPTNDCNVMQRTYSQIASHPFTQYHGHSFPLSCWLNVQNAYISHQDPAFIPYLHQRPFFYFIPGTLTSTPQYIQTLPPAIPNNIIISAPPPS